MDNQDDDDDLLPEYPDWQIRGGVRGLFAGRRPLNHKTIEIKIVRLADGRWCARSAEFPDAAGYGEDTDGALDQAEDRISAIINDRVARGEMPPTGLSFAFDIR